MENFIRNSQSVFIKQILSLVVITAFFISAIPVKSQTIENGFYKTNSETETNELVSTSIVISQFQTNGGGTNPANDEFIELHNVSGSPFDLNGYRLVYRSATGTNDVLFVSWNTSTSIPPGGYYLIGSASYDGSVTPNVTYNAATCSCSLGSAGGGLAIKNSGGTVIDSVGWGTATNIFIEGGATSAPPANGSQTRASNGCQDTDNNANDFSTLTTSAPRNTSSSVNICGGATVSLSATGAATPNTVLAGGTTKLTVTVTPGSSPASTGIAVTVNLSAIGGAAAQTFYDNGTNGDVTAGDNIFSYDATVAAGTTSGAKSLPVTVTDDQLRTANATISLTVGTSTGGSHVPGEHLVLGNPCNAVTDPSQPTNYLLLKNQWVASYHRDRGIPNWVSWHLDSTWLGSTPRQDSFGPDLTLPSGWYRVSDASYSGSGFDRGHHTPSGDRTSSVADNDATFLMTNMMPQAGGNNQGPWNDLEVFVRNFISQGNEVYNIAGGYGMGGIVSGTTVVNTIDSGRVTVPAKTWKIVVVMPVGDNDAARVTSSTRVIGVIMPNYESIRSDNWDKYLATVDQIEELTGCDYLSNVDTGVQSAVESKLDSTNTAPVVTNRSFTTAEDTSVSITLSGTDYNVNNVLDFSIVSNPANGSVAPAAALAPNATNFVYTPNANFFGTDTFTYKANDSTADSNTATVTVTVTSVNDAPVAGGDTKSTDKNVPLTFAASTLTTNDNAGAPNESSQTLTVSRVITTAQTNGTVSLVNGQITYQPANNFTGTASFDYEICDNGTTNGSADPKCSIATVTVNVLLTTAATTSISGKVLNQKGRGISGATVSLTDSAGNIREVRTNVFGYYRISDIAAGENYVVNVRHKLYAFMPQVVSVNEEINELIITAIP